MKTRLTTELRSSPVTRHDGRCTHRPSAATGVFVSPHQPRGVLRSPLSALRSSSGFTLVELLVVIGILVLLIGILFPVLTKVRAAGARTKSMAVINNLAQAIEAYHMQFGAYPGPVSNNALRSMTHNVAGSPTSSENLFLGLSGGAYYDSGTNTIKWNNTAIYGLGPLNLRNGKQYPPFIEGVPHTPYDGNPLNANDTMIPEYTDGYGDNMPVLYLRANTGNTGIASEDLTTQYDASELYPYTQALGSGQGLNALGLVGDPLLKTANNVLPFVRSPVMGSQPRKVDSFILIGAGPDRLFGTADDITNFGDVMP